MSANSSIEWTHHTFNPWWGCTKVSPACAHCYAERDSKRYYSLPLWGDDASRRFFGDDHWNDPIRWNRRAEKLGERQRVFCASMADVFEDRADLALHRERLWRTMQQCQRLDWLLLTKRPENFEKLLPWGRAGSEGWGRDRRTEWRHAWLGVTCEDKKHGLPRVEILRRTPAVIRFLSVEPLLEELGTIDLTGIDWVIVGGESGSGARPMHPRWVRNIRDQCIEAGVAFHFKQWGQHVPFDHATPEHVARPDVEAFPDMPCYSVGKHVSGRILDGRTHDAFPQPRSAAS